MPPPSLLIPSSWLFLPFNSNISSITSSYWFQCLVHMWYWIHITGKKWCMHHGQRAAMYHILYTRTLQEADSKRQLFQRSYGGLRTSLIFDQLRVGYFYRTWYLLHLPERTWWINSSRLYHLHQNVCAWDAWSWLCPYNVSKLWVPQPVTQVVRSFIPDLLYPHTRGSG